MTSALSGRLAPPDASSPASPESAALHFLRTLKTPARVLVAYSGGGDSSGLLAALDECVKADPSLGIELVAATVDHGLRPDSGEEARNAGELCARLGIRHHILAWEGEKPRTGIQAAAREARYRLLAALAAEIGADVIVTAHTLDDQAETVAMRKLRNPDAETGMSGAVLYDRRIWVCRPFLDVSRADIRALLVSRGIGWVDDPSNENTAFERVRIRQALCKRPDRAAFAAARAARRALADETARFLRANAVIHSMRVVVLDLEHYSRDHPAHLQAALYLAALIGGRTHVAGRDAAARIARFVEDGEQKRLNIERTVLDRRKQKLYLVRERRALPEAIIRPGSSAIWDGRFQVDNRGNIPARIGAGGEGCGTPLISAALPADLPSLVRRLAGDTQPRLLEGDIRGVSVEPIVATFVHFLPWDVLQIADALAFLGGLAHFRQLPTR